MRALSVLVALAACSSIPDDVQPIAWNREPCAHCHMLIGDPAYAAQVITVDGAVLSFDDPDCAARYLAEHPGPVHRAWFHAGRGDAWLAIGQVAFARAATSPMGSGVIAVPRGTPGALSLDDIAAAHRAADRPSR